MLREIRSFQLMVPIKKRRSEKAWRTIIKRNIDNKPCGRNLENFDVNFKGE